MELLYILNVNSYWKLIHGNDLPEGVAISPACLYLLVFTFLKRSHML